MPCHAQTLAALQLCTEKFQVQRDSVSIKSYGVYATLMCNKNAELRP